MRYFIIAGEASGDLHGSALIEQIKRGDKDAVIQGWGGPKMEAAGMEKLMDYSQLAYMGFIEVVQHLPEIFKNFKLCKKQIKAFQADAVIFIDYPGFNLRMAKWAKKNGYKTFYYVSPQIWAWKENRIHSIKKYIDEMMVILPFEKGFYDKHKYNVHYVGHPLTHRVLKSLYEPFPDAWDDQPIISLFPGSRKQEVEKHLDIMVKVASFFPNYQFYIAKAPNLDASIYKPFINRQSNVHINTATTEDLLKLSEAAIITSGTATLEAALFGVPQVVCYRGNWLSYQFAKSVIKVPFISLVNLILDKRAVEELIQEECNPTNIVAALQRLFQTDRMDKIQTDYTKLWETLGEKNASLEAAKIIINKTKKEA